jgi:hypothetical protein
MILSHALRAASVKPTITYNATANSGVDLTTYTFTGVGIGTAATNRLVYIAVTFTAAAARRISSATIGGISATIVDFAAQGNGTFFIYANVPTGTTATVAITFDAVCLRCLIGSYSIFDLKSTTPLTTAFATTWSSGSISASVNVPADGIIIAGVNNSTNTNAISWTNVTSRYSAVLDAAFISAGASTQVTTGGSVTVTATATSAASGRIGVYVWR